MKTLKKVLLINSMSSGTTGLGLIAVPSFVASLFETQQIFPFMAVGMFLLAFAVVVFLESRKNPPREKGVRLIILLDGSWVAASLIVIVLQLLAISFLGYVIIGAVAAWVGLMAVLQYSGLHRLTLSNKI